MVTINAITGNTGGDAAGDKLYLIDGLRGSAYDDILTGDANNNIIEGGKGADMLDGKGGTDFVSYAHSSKGVVVYLKGGHQINWPLSTNIKANNAALTAADANKYIIATKSGSGWTVSLGSTSETNDSDTRILGKLDSTGQALDSSFNNDVQIRISNQKICLFMPRMRGLAAMRGVII